MYDEVLPSEFAKEVDDDAPPTAQLLSTKMSYSQVYLVHAKDPTTRRESKGSTADDDNVYETMFRCGNWAYVGRIQFGNLRLTTADIPVLIPALQKQQGSLRYYCNSANVPSSSDYALPLQFLSDAVDFFALEMVSEGVERELKKMANVFPWINDDTAHTHFELGLSPDLPSYMDNIALIAAKTYTRGLVIITIYAEGCLYFVLASGEGDQALLDVRFPDVSKHGQGLHLASYPFNTPAHPYRKLTLWHSMTRGLGSERLKDLPRVRTLNVSSKSYEQTYCILKSSWEGDSTALSVHHDVLFRFGSWCYAGRVQLIPKINLSDVPFVIPALRIQQSRLDFLCEVTSVPTTSPFAGALEYVQKYAPVVENLVSNADDALRAITSALHASGQGEEARSINEWLAGDSSDSFFELSTLADAESVGLLKNIELIASKVYHSSGVITLSAYYDGCVYVCVQDGSRENPLLDSKFPDFSSKGRGVQLAFYKDAQGYSSSSSSSSSYSSGAGAGSGPGSVAATAVSNKADLCPDWTALRHVSIWQTKSAFQRSLGGPGEEFGMGSHTNSAQSLDKLSKDAQDDDDDGYRASDLDSTTAEGKSPEGSPKSKRVYRDVGSGGGATHKGREGYEEWGEEDDYAHEFTSRRPEQEPAEEKSSGAGAAGTAGGAGGAAAGGGRAGSGLAATRSSYLTNIERKLLGVNGPDDSFPSSSSSSAGGGGGQWLEEKVTQRQALEEGRAVQANRPSASASASASASGAGTGAAEAGTGAGGAGAAMTQAETARIAEESKEQAAAAIAAAAAAVTNNGGSPSASGSASASTPGNNNSNSSSSGIAGGMGIGMGLGRGLGGSPLGSIGGSPSTNSSGGGGGPGMSLKVARPHHLPKMALNDGLARRMDDIKRSMENEGGAGGVGAGGVPWDATGRPLARQDK